jgi:glycosyltransferase involved in cell wall biosynthesis
MSSLPLISAKCITYGRTHFLEESIYSFLIQNYPGPKEMIIINDYPLQTLVFDHPEVKIINVQETFPTIGDKENFALQHCNGELIAVWDDDDVAMPNHMSNIYKYFAQDANLLQWSRGVLFNGDNVEAITGLGNSGIVYTKKIWEELGGHPLEKKLESALPQTLLSGLLQTTWLWSSPKHPTTWVKPGCFPCI